jgi:hypothetical protein
MSALTMSKPLDLSPRYQASLLLRALQTVCDLQDQAPALAIKKAIRGMVSKRAYDLWKERTSPTDIDRWLKAEEESAMDERIYGLSNTEWEVRKRAYFAWYYANMAGPLDDWIRAEQEILGHGVRVLD